MQYGHGRVPSPLDPRDFLLRHYLTAPQYAHRSWDVGPVLNQGMTPHCVGFAGANWGNCLPIDDEWSNDKGHALYYAVKDLEGQPGEENGAYVRDLAKVLRAEGRIGRYAFGDLDEARDFVLTQGPIVLGIDWYEGMYHPDALGRVRPSGSRTGGHAILLFGCDEQYACLQNSWGDAWGVNGCCFITWDDLERCFGYDGEAMAAVELPLCHPPVPPVLPWWRRALEAVADFVWRLFH